MPLPQSVQAQADFANRFFQPETNTDPEAPASADEGGSPDPENQADEQNQPATEPEPPESQAQHDPRDGDAAYWQHRHSVEAGRLRQANEENRSLRLERDQLRERVTQLESQAESPTKPDLEEALAVVRDEYGEDFIDSVGRVAKAEIDKARQEEEARRAREEQQRTQQTFVELLDKRMPNWRQINNDPAFLQWLGVREADGRTRQERLNDAAHTQQDPYAVASIFEEFLNRAQTPEPQQPSRGVPDDQVQPRQSRSTQGGNDELTWTNDSIKQFFRDKARGRYSAQEAQRLEADIAAAPRQGRYLG